MIDKCREGEEGEKHCVGGVRGRGGRAQQTLENVMGGGKVWGGGEEREVDHIDHLTKLSFQPAHRALGSCLGKAETQETFVFPPPPPPSPSGISSPPPPYPLVGT